MQLSLKKLVYKLDHRQTYSSFDRQSPFFEVEPSSKRQFEQIHFITARVDQRESSRLYAFTEFEP